MQFYPIYHFHILLNSYIEQYTGSVKKICPIYKISCQPMRKYYVYNYPLYNNVVWTKYYESPFNIFQKLQKHEYKNAYIVRG